ncbi:MAG: hypothetical protein FD143_2474 [Ignavibacteria bacterium]|nr:MAG: hypothetical protein FD143_2474 [Ignavibacteria bacterium]KAF0157281.1 MAG: hypothetical protein FD188_2799 [Ignavibacteria bacterium]
MKKFISPAVCGFAAGVLQVVPLIKSFACCLIIPGAAFLSLWLDQKASKSTNKIPMKKALVFGLFTGLTAAFFGTVFEVFVTFITRQNDVIVAFPELQRMIADFPLSPELKNQVMEIFQTVRKELMETGFSWLYTFTILFNNLIVNSIFGIVGGLIGAQILNSKNKSSEA